MSTRRKFLHETACGTLTALAAASGVPTLLRSEGRADAEGANPAVHEDSDIGSLYPFVQYVWNVVTEIAAHK